MHKFILDIFSKIKNIFQFLKIVDVFLIMMLLLFWVEHLVHSQWNWMNFLRPFMDSLVSAGAVVNDSSIKLFEAVFEYKYFIAIVFLLFFYFLLHFIYMFTCGSENVYNEGRKQIHKIQETTLNKQLEDEQLFQQKKLQSYVIYISGALKTDSVTKLSNINLEEQINLMNKFLIEKTGTNPVKFDNGFIYKFYKFDKIDFILDIFFRVIRSKAPLDYQVCLLIEEDNKVLQDERLRNLINLGFMNKISMLSNVAYRYKFVENPKYETSMLGLFQKNNNTIEVHEFIEPYAQF